MRERTATGPVVAVLVLLCLPLGTVAQSEGGADSAEPINPSPGSDAGSETSIPEAEESAESPSHATVLPWNRRPNDAPNPPQKRRSSAKEMLNLYGIDESQILQLEDGRPLVSDEEETLWKVLYRLPFLGRDRLELWKREDATASDIETDPDSYRLEVFRMEGRVQSLRRIELPDESAERLQFSRYYELRVDLADSPVPLQVFVRTVPEAWESTSDINEHASFMGLFLKKGGLGGEHAELVFAAERMAWHPDHVSDELGVTDSAVLLGGMRMDVGLMDGVRKSNRKELEADDGDAFYGMLAAMRRAELNELWLQARTDADLAMMLTQPESLQGELVRLEGTVRRIQKVMVREEALRDWVGFDHYYQLDVFVPLGDQEVRLGADPDQQDAPVFVNAYPVTCCVLDLPPGLEESAKLSESVRFAGFYFKLWAYRTEFISSHDHRQLQIGPLLVGPTVELTPKPEGMSPWEWSIGAAFLAILFGLALGVWLFYRSDRQFEKQSLRKQFEVDAGKSLDNMGIEANDGPDFTGIEPAPSSPDRD